MNPQRQVVIQSNREYKSCTTLERLLNDEEFADVILVTQDEKQIKAHKAILCSSSDFLRKVMAQNPHPHPLLYLLGIKAKEFEAIKKFIYIGKCEVSTQNLEMFFDAAKILDIKGMVDEISQGRKEQELIKVGQSILKPKDELIIGLSPSVEDIKTENDKLNEIEENDHTSSNSNFKKHKMQRSDSSLQCDQCEYIGR